MSPANKQIEDSQNNVIPLIRPTGRTSAVRVMEAWYVLCESKELDTKPIRRVLYGTPIALFRTKNGEVGALLDRCPHRNVPLSGGKVMGTNLQCNYHGWEFGLDGACNKIPCLTKEPQGKSRNADSFATCEQDGYVWVYATPNVDPKTEPFRFPYLDNTRYVEARASLRMPGSVHATAENALDVPHTSFLHTGLFRSAEKKNPITVQVRRDADSVVAEYIGEPRPEGLFGKLLSPSGGVVTHFDRFILPCIAQVEYSLGDDIHIVASTALTPIEDNETQLYGSVALRLPRYLPQRVLAKLFRPIGLWILHQDKVILQSQRENISRFGGEDLASTEVDVLGPHIFKLMRDAARQKRDTEVFEREFEMQA